MNEVEMKEKRKRVIEEGQMKSKTEGGFVDKYQDA